MKKQVKILGKQYDIAFNFKTIIVFEQLTGKAFDVSSIGNTSSQVNLNWCALQANNDDAPDYDKFLSELTPNEFKDISEALAVCINEWYKPMISSKESPTNAEEPKND